jgi:tetratricopeptide (TPR) repeat protein
MRKLSHLILAMTIVSHAFSQEYNIDSLKQILSKEGKDTNAVRVLDKIAEGYFYFHPDSTYWFARQGMLLADQMHDQRGVVFSLEFMGMGLRQMGNYPGALRMLLQSMRICEQEKFNEELFHIFHQIASVYYFQKDDSKCIEYELKAFEVREQGQKNEDIAISDNYTSGAFEDLNQMDSSLYYQNLACAASLRLGEPERIAFNEVNLADIYFKLNRDAAALENYRKAMPYLITKKSNEALCESSYYMARIFERQNKMDSALDYGHQSLSLAQSSYLTSRQQDASNFLASLYENAHNADSTLKYLKMSIALKDSIFNKEKVTEMQNLTFEENIRQQEIAAQKKQAEENHIRNLQLLAIGIFIPIFFLIVLFLSRTKVSPRVVEFLGILSLLLFFEFITDLIYPFVSNWTNENPIWEMLFLVILAASLEPINFRLEHWVKRHLVHKSAVI